MKNGNLLVLCVDGLDPDYARELDFPKMPYESKLKIPKELYHNEIPHTQLIWPSMLSGKIVITNLESNKKPNIHLGKIRLPIRNLLHKYGIKWKREKIKEKTWGINPSNVNIKTIADEYNSIMWNFPTICPEFVCEYPTLELMFRYGWHEYKIWKIVTDGMCLYPYNLSIAYCHFQTSLGI